MQPERHRPRRSGAKLWAVPWNRTILSGALGETIHCS